MPLFGSTMGFIFGISSADEPVGTAGQGTFGYDIEVDATLTYQWQTTITPAQSGLEQRRSLLARPRQRYQFSSVLTDVQQRAVLAKLSLEGPQASLFLLGLWHEALPARESSSSTITMHSLVFADWAVAGQRIGIRGRNGVIAETWIVSVSGVDLEVNDDVSAVALDGALVFPLMQVRLDPTQELPRYQKNASRWNLVAWADRYRYGEDNQVGVGSGVTTHAGIPVWDQGALVEGTRSESIMTGVEMIDTGLGVSSRQDRVRANWGRGLSITSSRRSQWQWLKAFLDTVRGSWQAFLLRTGRPDLVPIGDASSGTLTIDTSAQSYAQCWYPSLAHRRLAIVLEDGSVNYRSVQSTAGGGATEDLVLNSALSGTIRRVEFLETCRLDSDEVSVKFGERGFRADMNAFVVQQ